MPAAPQIEINSIVYSYRNDRHVNFLKIKRGRRKWMMSSWTGPVKNCTARLLTREHLDHARCHLSFELYLLWSTYIVLALCHRGFYCWRFDLLSYMLESVRLNSPRKQRNDAETQLHSFFWRVKKTITHHTKVLQRSQKFFESWEYSKKVFSFCVKKQISLSQLEPLKELW